jgi:hypothetical protein
MEANGTSKDFSSHESGMKRSWTPELQSKKSLHNALRSDDVVELGTRKKSLMLD